jgi:hypothetical protein
MLDPTAKPGDIVLVEARIVELYGDDLQLQIDGPRSRHGLCVSTKSVRSHEARNDATVEMVAGTTRKIVRLKEAGR